MIHLISTVEPSRLNYVPQFIAHYALQGVQKFHLSVQIEPAFDPAYIAQVTQRTKRLASRLGIEPFYILMKEFDAMTLRAHHDKVQDAVGCDDDWVVWADIDEFHRFGNDLQVLTCDWDKAQVNAVQGVFIDRIARNGHLTTFDPQRSIWSQYPIGCDITRSVMGAITQKVVIARRDVRIGIANHQTLPNQSIAWLRRNIPIFHFKWTDGIIGRLNYRLSDEWKAKCGWWTESQTILDAIAENDGRLPLKELSIFDYQDDARPDDSFPVQTNPRYRKRWADWEGYKIARNQI